VDCLIVPVAGGCAPQTFAPHATILHHRAVGLSQPSLHLVRRWTDTRYCRL